MAKTKQSIKWLTTLDLENHIRQNASEKINKAFLGVYPINCLPRKIPYLPVLFIINTNSNNLPGQHWKAVYVSKDKIGEIFDSLATPISLQLQHWMNTFTKRWTPSLLTIQNPLSPSCGAYVIYYVLTRLKHKTLASCLKPFTINVFLNEDFVTKFFTLLQ